MATNTYRNSNNDTIISGYDYDEKNIYNTGNNVTIYGGHYKDYIENSGSNVLIYAGDRADEVVNSGDNTYINTGDGNDTTSNRGKNVTIYGGAGNDTITTYGNNSLVSLGSDSNSVNAYANNVTIKASHGHQTVQSKAGSGTYIQGSDSDEIITIQRNGSGSGVVATVQGGGGNDTFYGSAGADVFVYTGTDGNDVIYNWDSNDQILLTSGSVDDSMINDTGDVVLYIGYSNITIKDATNKSINVSTGSINTGGSTSTTTSTTLTVDDSTSSPVTTPANIITIDASSRTSAVRITGNSKANSIISGHGNDTLTGGAGNDVFIYSSGSGNDIITDYTAGQDKIKVTGARISRTNVSGSDVVLTVGSGSIRVKNGKGKSLSLYNNSNSVTTTVIGGSSISTTVTPSTLPSGLTYNNNRKSITAKSPFSGTISRASISGSNVVLTVGTGSLTINNARGKDINITDSSGETKTYNFTSTVNNPTRSFEERWFLEDNNIGDDEFTSIISTENNAVTTDIKFDSMDTLKNPSVNEPLVINTKRK